MAIETLEDIVEEIMDELGIYGAHDDRCSGDSCRCCQASGLTDRIRRAVEIESAVHAVRIGARK